MHKLEDFDSADPGHANVKENNIVDLALDKIDRLAAIGRRVDREFLGLGKFTFKERAKRLFVVNDEQIVAL